ncbi:uncharacterized protein LOC125675787 isoform X3 [Ostrea edulis]|uniref:uncharacterized protein LOC125675787 isoform X3 n=1 Tax=Ostrea edulis TaxID=37623 RepID=UPI0024AF460F|nr:uncharacterized protein LOC125675787 isoform X3 [Ostrea edulis]
MKQLKREWSSANRQKMNSLTKHTVLLNRHRIAKPERFLVSVSLEKRLDSTLQMRRIGVSHRQGLDTKDTENMSTDHDRVSIFVEDKANRIDIKGVLSMDETRKGSLEEPDLRHSETMEEILTRTETTRKLKRKRTQRDVDNRLVILTEESQNIKNSVMKTDDGGKQNVSRSASKQGVESYNQEHRMVRAAQTLTADERRVMTMMSRRIETDQWLAEAASAAQRNSELKYQHGRGLDTIFILDTSASMEGDGFRQMKGVVIDILNEFERRSGLDTNVGVITFGHENGFFHYCSNRYYDIKNSLDELQCSGPSPIGAGLLLSLGTQGTTGISVIGKWHIRPRIILISDGKVTDHHYPEGPEDMDGNAPGQAVEELVQIVQRISDAKSIICVPVGEPDMTVLEMISGLSVGGKIVHLHEARKIGRFPVNVKIAEQVRGIANSESMNRSRFQTVLSNFLTTDQDLTESDWDDIYEMATGSGEEFKSMEDIVDEDLDSQCQERNPNMPPIGTRVRRGPGWQWDDQDSNGPGTVTGHSKNPGWISVEWDTGNGFQYRYGADASYDIVVCDSPRVLLDEMIAVGCLVTRGPDWEWGNQDGGTGNIGSVYRVDDRAIIHVRWPNGNKSNYRFGFDGKFDVTLCDPFSSEVKRNLQQQNPMALASSHTTVPETSFAESTKNIDKKAEKPESSTDRQETLTLDDIRRTNDSLNIMDMAPPRKHTVWADFDGPLNMSTNAINNRNSSRNSGAATSTPHNNRDPSKRGTSAKGDKKEHTGNVQSVHLQEDVQNDKTSEQNVSNVSDSSGASTVVDSVTVITHRPSESGEESKLDDRSIQSKEIGAQSNPGENQPSRNYEIHTTNDSQKTNDDSNVSIQEQEVTTAIWEWKDSDGQWVKYPSDVQEKLRKNYLKNPKASVLVSMDDVCFRVVFSKNKQINTETKETLEIRKS